MRFTRAGLVLLSVVSGLLMAFSFPLGPPLPLPNIDGWWPAAWVCLAPLMLAASRARSTRPAAGLGLISGMTSFGMILCWMGPFLARWARLSLAEAAGVSSLLILYVASYVAVFAACLEILSRRFGAAGAFLLAPAAWTGLELLRGTILTGFPWCLLGSSQQPAPIVTQVASIAGVYGVSFALAAFGGAVAWFMDRVAPGPRQPRRRLIIPAALLSVVAAAAGYGGWTLTRKEPAAPSVPIALVQANVAQEDKWEPGESARIEADHVQMTRQAAAGGARLIVWSESSVPISITHHPDYAHRLAELSDATNADLLVGTVTYERHGGSEAPFNSAVLVRPGRGIVGRYDKIHLVPFGEYVPLKRFLFFLEPLVAEASDFMPGDDITLLGGNTLALGTVICYEAIFPGITRKYSRAGATLIVNITNDSWYGDTAMPRQHLLQAAMRAVESRRWLLRCASTGISAVVDPAGRIVARAEFERREILHATVTLASGTTVYAAIGDVFAIGCVILTLASLAMVPFPRPARAVSPGEMHAR